MKIKKWHWFESKKKLEYELKAYFLNNNVYN